MQRVSEAFPLPVKSALSGKYSPVNNSRQHDDIPFSELEIPAICEAEVLPAGRDDRVVSREVKTADCGSTPAPGSGSRFRTDGSLWRSRRSLCVRSSWQRWRRSSTIRRDVGERLFVSETPLLYLPVLIVVSPRRGRCSSMLSPNRPEASPVGSDFPTAFSSLRPTLAHFLFGRETHRT